IQTSWYRAVVESGSGSEIIVAPVKVNVQPKAVGGIATGPAQVCSSGNDFDLGLAAHTGDVDKWLFSENKIVWNDVAGSSGKKELSFHNLNNSGYFKAVIRSGSTCDTVHSSALFIEVNEMTQAGVINGATTVCEGNNHGVLNLSGYKGQVLRWEISGSGGTPWSSVVNLTDTISYQNLSSTMWYRALVKNGSCPVSLSSAVSIKVDKNSAGGFVLGSSASCSLTNAGELNVSGNTGTILNWQYSLDKGMNWVDTLLTDPSLEYKKLTRTTYYRALIKNGVCLAQYSSNAKIIIYPLPQVAFTTISMPQGMPMEFKNGSVIKEGSLKQFYWDFGDGNGTPVKAPVHTYSNAGSYKVKLEATSDKGCIDSISSIVSVYEVPQVNFEFSNVCLKDDEALFMNTSTVADPSAGYSWDFGDGESFSGKDNPIHKYSHPGNYKVKLTAATSHTSSSFERTITVYDQAIPDFEARGVCQGTATSFVNHSSIANGYLTYQWDFDDGATSSELNPAHLYSTADSFNVRLVTISNYNCSDTVFKKVFVNPNPVANFSATNASYGFANAFENLSTVKSGNMEHHWELGDGHSTNNTSFEYVYSSAGNYDVSLVVKTDSGCTNAIKKTIWVYPKPYVNFSFNNDCVYDSVHFSNQSTVSSGTLKYRWDFGDGDISIEAAPVKKYSQPGNYVVKLIAVSSDGNSDSLSKNITIYPQPVADYVFKDVCDGYPVLLTDASTISNGIISDYLWDFGDGTNAVRASVSKTYLNPGRYTVSLSVTSVYGCRDTAFQKVTVHSNPVASFTIRNVCFGLPVSISNNSSYNSDLSYLWNMGNGYTPAEETPYYVYPASGTYKVKLKVTAGVECSDSLEREVTIYPLPSVNAGNDTSITKGFGIRLNAAGAEKYIWNPGTGLSDPSSATPIVNPTSETLYILTGEDQHGCIAQDSVLISVDDQHKIIAANIITPDGNGMNDTWFIQNIESYPEALIVIYDRWGNKVFETRNYSNDWDGTNAKNDILPDGTYYYIIRFPDDNTVYNGAINILRNVK
ncbi:MAG TPA: PKD domain-containing protein, partial [Bacteroidales bacterium]|nr:PKD domain-containing protein [Bacteroidales bacterium]